MEQWDTDMSIFATFTPFLSGIHLETLPCVKSLKVLDTAHNCAKCGDHRTRVIGRTESPSAIHVRCNRCGHVFSVSTAGSVSDGEKKQR
jgi:transcription elongation factor Elf1